MRIDILGLELDRALAMLEKEGISAEVTMTSAPRRRDEKGGVMRVVYASDDGRQLTAAVFVDPIEDSLKENG